MLLAREKETGDFLVLSIGLREIIFTLEGTQLPTRGKHPMELTRIIHDDILIGPYKRNKDDFDMISYPYDTALLEQIKRENKISKKRKVQT